MGLVSNLRCEKHGKRRSKNAFLIASEQVFLSIPFPKNRVRALKISPLAVSRFIT
jgi:hypothetical protein